MSCNGCRVLRKGCSDTCVLRQCLKWIEGADAQGHATVFVAKFFGRAGMMALIGSVPESQRPALFQSLLYEACGRTINPVFGAVGLLCSGNWDLCQEAVDTVMKGGLLCSSSPSTGTGRPGACFPAPATKARGPASTQAPSLNLKRKAGVVETSKFTTTTTTNNNNDSNSNLAPVRKSSRRRTADMDDQAECNKTRQSNVVKLERGEADHAPGLDLTLGSSSALVQLGPNFVAPKRTGSPCPSEADSGTTELSLTRPTTTTTTRTREDRLLDLLH